MYAFSHYIIMYFPVGLATDRLSEIETCTSVTGSGRSGSK